MSHPFAIVRVATAAAMMASTALSPRASLAAETSLRLDPAVHPRHYALTLTPDAANLRFAGDETIDLVLDTPQPALVLHGRGITILSASVTATGTPTSSPETPVTISADAATQTLRFDAGHPLAAGSYRLTVHYTGVISTQPSGLFALDTHVGGKTNRALFTQFEPTDARSLAPLFDEPGFKAVFELSAVVPGSDLPLSNTPVISETGLPDGRKLVHFAPTPPMASYLLFFGTGDFVRVARPALPGLTAGIVAPRGLAGQAGFALDELVPLMGYYTDYFRQPFPLPKIDNIAGAGDSQSFGAMENWGAIFTFQSYLLNDPALTTPQDLADIAEFQAHEVAHQWFGDLVTMAWWDDLWLNEGFASWMEIKATQHFHPDWGTELSRVSSRENAMVLDALVATHPIIQRVETAEQANQAFDEITYLKGAAVLTMLEAFAGEDVWRDGLRAYMAAHKFANARTDDLWQAVEAAGAPGLTRIAHDFTRQPGVPAVQLVSAVCHAGQTRVALRAGEFTADRIGQRSHMQWHVPLALRAGDGAVQRLVLDRPTQMATLPGCGPVLLNAGQQGYYRAIYPAAELARLAPALARLAPIDQAGVVADQLALAKSGWQPLGGALDLLAAIPADAHPGVVSVALRQWADLGRWLDPDPAVHALLAQRVTKLWAPRLAQLGYAPRPGEPLKEAVLRQDLIERLGRLGEPGVVAEARARFAALDHDPTAIDGPLKAVWLDVYARHADAAQWTKLAARAAQTTAPVERSTLYQALLATNDPVLIDKALALAQGSEPGGTISGAMFGLAAIEHPETMFTLFAAHPRAVLDRLDVQAQDQFVGLFGYRGATPKLVGQLEAWRATLAPGSRTEVDRALAKVRQRVHDGDRIIAETAKWLRRP